MNNHPRFVRFRSSLLSTFGCLALLSSSAGAAVVGQLGILDTSGINPATGVQWAPGDTYRLTFVTSTTTNATSTDINTYNAFVQGVAAGAGLGSVTWTAIGSTASVDAIDNTGMNPALNGPGEPILLMNGLTVIADNYADMWDGINVTLLGSGSDPANDHGRGIYFDENGNDFSPPGNADDRIFTGTNGDGTASGQPLGFAGNVSTGSTGSNFPAQFWGYNSGESTRWTQDFSFDGTQQQEMYGISETLTVVPEPGSTALALLGGLALLRRRRNR